LLPIGLGIVQIIRQRWRKTTNTAPTALLVQYMPQANLLLSMNNYTPLANSKNDKNKPAQALIAINKLFAI
jgi:hypothetical protein